MKLHFTGRDTWKLHGAALQTFQTFIAQRKRADFALEENWTAFVRRSARDAIAAAAIFLEEFGRPDSPAQPEEPLGPTDAPDPGIPF